MVGGERYDVGSLGGRGTLDARREKGRVELWARNGREEGRVRRRDRDAIHCRVASAPVKEEGRRRTLETAHAAIQTLGTPLIVPERPE